MLRDTGVDGEREGMQRTIALPKCGTTLGVFLGITLRNSHKNHGKYAQEQSRKVGRM